jgi:hypothetical protein
VGADEKGEVGEGGEEAFIREKRSVEYTLEVLSQFFIVDRNILRQ